jgi:enterochelin esterase-like enzyme
MAPLAALVVSLLLPGFTPLPVGGGAGAGQVLAGVLPGTSRTGYVYLPPGFTTERRYPVVYLLHGMPGSPSEFLDGTQLPEWADAQIGAGSIRPFIGVLPAAGPDHRYNGEWAGPWETALVSRIVPWVDAHLPTDPERSQRVLAGLSAGGFGAVDIGLRNPQTFGTLESWSGYFAPLHDGPFKGAGRALLAANNPVLLARAGAAGLRRLGTRFFVSSGPAHSHWFRPAQTVRFAAELRSLGLTPQLQLVPSEHGEWRAQLDAGLAWALRP